MRLGELGSVIDSVENDKTARLVRATSARVILAIQRQPGTNTVEVVEAVKKLLPQFRSSSFPPRCQPARSSTTARESIRESVDDVKFTLLLDARAGRSW